MYLTGIERNADQVVMTACAPLLARYDFTQWKAANLIWFDDTRVVLTPSYHVQRLFATHRGDRALPVELAAAAGSGPEIGVTAAHIDRDPRPHLAALSRACSPSKRARAGASDARVSPKEISQRAVSGKPWRTLSSAVR